MSLLDKFSAVEVKLDTRISEEDRMVCQTHQAAYEKAREAFSSFRRKWKEFVAEQQEIMSAVATESYVRERYYCLEGVSADKIRIKFEYTSTEWKDIYFVTYAGSIESNLMQMVMAKEKLNLFMKGQDADLDEIYDKFGVDYDLLSLLMRREADSEGKLHIRWGEQKIA